MARAVRSLEVTTTPPERSHAPVSTAAIDPIPALYRLRPAQCYCQIEHPAWRLNRWARLNLFGGNGQLRGRQSRTAAFRRDLYASRVPGGLQDDLRKPIEERAHWLLVA